MIVSMKRFLLIAASLVIAFKAEAVVIQKAGSALAYKNVVSTTGYVPKREVVKQSSLYRVHLTTSDSGTTSMNIGDEVEISLPVTSGQTWRSTYPGNVSITNDVVEGAIRKITFKLGSKNSSEITIDFDLYNSSNAIIKSKYATIRIK